MALACLTLLLLLAPFPAGFTETPVYVPLFTPRALPSGTYRTYTSRQDLDTILGSGVLAGIRGDPSRQKGQSSFEAEAVIASEAFGQSGGYNRWKLALLYGATRARIARGPRLENGRVVEAWTLISPYPDPELERLNPGTLLIVLRLQP
jgi:hypothetical protein